MYKKIGNLILNKREPVLFVMFFYMFLGDLLYHSLRQLQWLCITCLLYFVLLVKLCTCVEIGGIGCAVVFVFLGCTLYLVLVF